MTQERAMELIKPYLKYSVLRTGINEEISLGSVNDNDVVTLLVRYGSDELNKIREKIENEQLAIARTPLYALSDWQRARHQALGWVLSIFNDVQLQTQNDPYPDTEADGVIFCGKCGKLK